MLLLAGSALTFSPRAAQPSRSRPAIRSSRPVMGEACKDTVCYSLSNAKPESVEKLGPAQQHGQSDPLAVAQLGSGASSGRTWRLWVARHSQGKAQPLGSPRALKLVACKAADSTSFDHVGTATTLASPVRASAATAAG